MKINIIGAGRLGKNLALALIEDSEMHSFSIYNRTLESSQKAISEIGAGTPIVNKTDLAAADLTFITAPDDAIRSISEELATILLPGHFVVHCSGALSSQILDSIKKRGCLTASIHPLKAFSHLYSKGDAFVGCTCVIEGDEPVQNRLISLFKRLGAEVLSINASKKSTYHAGAVFASNYVVTLAKCALQLFTESGLSEQNAKLITQQLMQGSLKNLKYVDEISQALTGPIVRGDVATIQNHLQAIVDPEVNTFYRAAGRATLPMTELSDELSVQLKALFEG